MKQDALTTRIQDLASSTPASQNAMIAEIPVPNVALQAALSSGRGSLVLGTIPEDATDEARALYRIVAVLVDTNDALRRHATAVADLVGDWTESFKGLHTLARQIDDLANFRQPVVEE